MKYPFNIFHSLFLLTLVVLMIPITSHSEEMPVLGYNVYGSGSEKVIVLHDWMGDSANYEPIIPYLDPATFTWVFADVRGYGFSKHLTGKYTVNEVSGDVFHLADYLGWQRFHVVGHSMNGMTVQRMAIDDWKSGHKRLKSVVAVTPVTADGYPANEETKQFLWSAIHNRNLSEQAFSGLTGKKLLPAWSRIKTTRNLAASSIEAMQGYYRMWLETDFSEDAFVAKVGTPIRVIGGRQDLPGFQEKKYNATLAVWYPNIEIRYITDAGHYPMQETPVRFATLVEEFLHMHR
ncbi:MAG: alpha/beta hydrolase [Candidatus Thiodiazotropha sp.]